jgi:hypothetical protein
VNGKLTKATHIIERVVARDHSGNYVERDITYVGDHDFQRLSQISALQTRLSEFRDYTPYFNEELGKLWNEVTELATLEIVQLEGKENEKETQTQKKGRKKGKATKSDQA